MMSRRSRRRPFGTRFNRMLYDNVLYHSLLGLARGKTFRVELRTSGGRSTRSLAWALRMAARATDCVSSAPSHQPAKTPLTPATTTGPVTPDGARESGQPSSLAALGQAREYRNHNQEQRCSRYAYMVSRTDSVEQRRDCRVAARAMARPAAIPNKASSRPSLMTIRSTPPWSAPSAMRIPISRVRWLTE